MNSHSDGNSYRRREGPEGLTSDEKAKDDAQAVRDVFGHPKLP
jgi:hypothetical protein